MATGGDFKPYRLPCGGAPSCWLGSFFQHAKTIEQVEKFNNTTITHVGTPGATSGTTPAYERWAVVNTGVTSCETNNCNPASAPCTPWIGVDQGYPTVQYTMVNGQPNTAPQSFSDSGTKVDLRECHKRGFKNVAAMRRWHGRWGFFTGQQTCDDTHCSLTGPPAVYKSWRAYGSSPQQFKYLTMNYSVQVTEQDVEHNQFNDTMGGVHHNVLKWNGGATVAGTINVDPSSGIKTLSGFSSTATKLDHNLTGESYAATISGAPAPSDIVTINVNFDPDAPTFVPTYAYQNDISEPAMADALVWGSSLDGCGGQLLNGYVGTGVGVIVTDYLAANPGWHDAAWWQANLPLMFTNPPGIGCDTMHYPVTNTWTVSMTDTNISINGHVSCSQGSPGGDPTPDTANFTINISITLSNPNTSAAMLSDIATLLGQWPLNDDALYPWRTDGKQQVAPLVTRLEASGEISPGPPIYSTVNDLTSPINDAVGNAPWTSATTPPPFGWTYAPHNNDSAGRAFGSTGYTGPQSWQPTYSQINWFDIQAFQWYFPAGYGENSAAASGKIQMYDGSIQGAPKPAGYQNYFRWDFADWSACCHTDGSSSNMDWYVEGNGMWLEDFNAKSGAQIPLNATQWTELYSTLNKAPGACLIYNDQQPTGSPPGCPYGGGADESTALWGVKYAEVLDRWPSQNFARPGGADKFAYDETKVYCVVNISGSGAGSTWTVTDYTGATPPDGTDFSGTWGGASVGGFFSVSGYSGGTLTLGAKQFNLPSDWASKSGDDSMCFGKLRFPTAPSLLGRIGVTVDPSDMTGKTLDWNNAQTNFGMSTSGTSDQVDIFDRTMTLLASNVTGVRVSDDVFTVPASYPTAAWVMIHGAPAAWYMNDTFCKGDFVTMDWTWDYRTNGEYTRLTGITDCAGTQVTRPTQNLGYAEWSEAQHCLPAQPCNPPVVCFSPNGESFPNGITIGFPASFTLDEIYGSRWQGYVMATMTDLFWQPPHHPCGGTDPLTELDFSGANIVWTEDDGTCQADFVDTGTGLFHKFYPFAPQVECRLTLPNNYGYGANETPSALPSGITIGFESPVTTSNPDTAYPPGYVGYDMTGKPNQVMSADIMWSRFCAADPSCRFYSVYHYYALNCA